ncbi:hypothetical protein BFP72_14595 [Reichenbachiella sp. 5M10]|uniref:DUF6134 family protein n=1 Tax=Reichenbachiella sp. 5M10 TaxID=1889772 RepID=UPI000C15B5E6|nr:DUF6134 family protein [Reichenbachiella sp. 5M10]PIB36540.1 hypothetical protein BFP72_14595 [Reichenbachiella sp. 5M10]
MSSSAQTLNYEIVKGGNVIGNMTAKRIVKGDSMFYSISSVTHFRVVVKLRVDYNLTETYVNGVLYSGHALSTLNGATQKESKVERRKGYYHIERDSDFLHFESTGVKYSIPEIYFSEPVGKGEVFSQIFGTNLIIENRGNHVYHLESEDGDNTYTYKKGVCVEVKVNRTYATFYIRLKSK